MDKLRAVFEVCNFQFYYNFSTLQVNITSDEPIIKLIKDITPQRDEIIGKCLWGGQPFDCGKFKQVITPNGVCYSLNTLNSRDMYTNQYVLIKILISL